MNDENQQSAASAGRPQWMRLVMSLLRILAIVLVSLFVMTMFIANKVIFQPTKYPPESIRPYPPAPNGCRDIYMKTETGERLHAWYREAENAKATIIFLHGNAGCLDGRRGWISSLGKLPANVFAIDYRGYGRSDGSPSEDGIYEDAEMAWTHLTEHMGIPSGSIVVYGISLGGAPACELATRRECAGLIIQSTFTSISDMANQLMWPLPLGWFVGTSMDNESKVATITMPKLIIHSRDDEMIPYGMAEELRSAAADPVELITFDGAGHNSLVVDHEEQLLAAMRRFIGELGIGAGAAK